MVKGMVSLRLGVTLPVVASCVVSALLVLTDMQSPVRPASTLLGLTAGTGLAVTGWMDSMEPSLFGALTLSTGTAITFFVSLFAVEARWWHPTITVAGLLIASAVSLECQLAAGVGRRSRNEGIPW